MLMTTMRYFGLFLITLLAVSLTVMLKDIVSVYASLAAVILLPVFSENMGITLYRYVNPANLTRSAYLFEIRINIFLLLYGIFILLIGVLTGFTAVHIQKGLKG